jgi:hypothetical protein
VITIFTEEMQQFHDFKASVIPPIPYIMEFCLSVCEC